MGYFDIGNECDFDKFEIDNVYVCKSCNSYTNILSNPEFNDIRFVEEVDTECIICGFKDHWLRGRFESNYNKSK